MKIKHSLLILAALAATSISAMENQESKNDLNSTQLNEVKKSVKLLQNNNLQIIQGRDLGAVYFLQIKASGPQGQSKLMEAFVDKTTNSIYVGGGYDKNGIKISFPLNVEKINKGVSFTYGTGKRELYLVTDPRCPYCAKFFNEADLSEFKVNVILLALPMHPKSKLINAYIAAGKDNAEKYSRYVKMMSDKTKDKESLYKDFKVNEELERVSSYASQELGVRGTPTFFEKIGNNFRPVQWQELVSAK